MTLSMILDSLLEVETDPSVFETLHRGFSVLPHSDGQHLDFLFDGCLRVCLLAQEFDHDAAADLSGELFSCWQNYKAAHSN